MQSEKVYPPWYWTSLLTLVFSAFTQRPISGSAASALTKFGSVRTTSPFMIAVLWPAAAGSPASRSTAGSTTGERIPAQPLAPGAAKALSTSDVPVAVAILPRPANDDACPRDPLMGPFGGGGLVVPVVRFNTTGSPSDPM